MIAFPAPGSSSSRNRRRAATVPGAAQDQGPGGQRPAGQGVPGHLGYGRSPLYKYASGLAGRAPRPGSFGQHPPRSSMAKAIRALGSR